MSDAHHTVLLVGGPTGSGKSALALALAERLGGEIVNADSQQVYRGLDRGTAKPSHEEQDTVPHHLCDLAGPGEGMDAARWLSLADAAVTEIARRGALPILCGGSGLYLRTFLRGVAEAPGRDPALRAALEEEAARFGRPALHRRLAAIDAAAAARIGENDLVRIVRALEMAAGGRTQSELFAAHAARAAAPRHRARLLVLDPPRDELHRRIDARLPSLFEGLLAEAALLDPGLLGRVAALSGPDAPGSGDSRGSRGRLPLGYAEAAEVLAGKLARDEAERRVRVAHHRYARRQVIWMRREPLAEWLRPPVDVAALAADLAAWRAAAPPR